MLNILNLLKLKRFYITKRILILSFVLFVFNQSQAQPGTLDFSFDPGMRIRGGVHCISIQSDGKIIVGGQLYNHDLTESFGVARLNKDGSLDTSFQQGTDASWVSTVSIQNNGKIIIGGRFITSNETHIARLNPDGSLDTSFDVGTGANSFVNTTAIQNDGKIIIGGRFSFYNGISRNRIARLNTDGSLDTTFDPGTGANYSTNEINTTSVQSDGKIIIGGWFTDFDGIETNGIARLNVDGSLDTSFDPEMGAGVFGLYNIIRSCFIQNDGKIIIGGYFTTSNETEAVYVARMNNDGTIDSTFDMGTELEGDYNNYNNPQVKTISVQSDGKIIVGGIFSSYNGKSRNSIACLNTDGSIDTSFDPGSGASPEVSAISIQDDGKIVLGGLGAYNGTPRKGVARIMGTLYIEDLIENVENITIFPNPISDKATLVTDVKLEDAELTVYNSLGKRVNQIRNIYGHFVTFNRNNLPAGLYFIQFTQGDQIIVSDKILIVE